MEETRYVQRYSDADRMNHWALVILFFCAALSGLSMFHPSLFFLSTLFGGGPWTRILHPFIGVLVFLSFGGMYLRLARDNVWGADDRAWMAGIGAALWGRTHELPPAGRYNAGQKILFWWMALCVAVLLVTGLVFWRPYFVGYFPIGLVRVATLVHSLTAVGLILGIIGHIYAAIWVKGTTRAMTRGVVSESWARRHHPHWVADVTQQKR
ncbi:MAG TPA: formate dehydrogenase subunit gamma [Burkholderiaceae bacterium]|jgi:formate dehydrogenase subunit gamma|nr:formate dehydrogenase subunit gamma [Burkholderiaceae bacterium]